MRTLYARLAALSLLVGAACRPPSDTSTGTTGQALTAPKPTAPARPGALIVREQFIRAVGDHPAPEGLEPEEAALHHLTDLLTAFGATAGDLAWTELKALHNLGSQGRIAWFRQRVDGIEVYPSEVRLLMRPDHSLVAVGGRLPSLVTRMPAFTPNISMEEALAITIRDLMPIPVTAAEIVPLQREQADFRFFDLVEGLPVRTSDARVKPLFFLQDGVVEAAYFVELYVGWADDTDAAAYRHIVSARTGDILDRRNLTLGQSFDYRVWADETGGKRPQEGPITDFTPHPTGTPSSALPAIVPRPPLVTMDGFNTNPSGAADPWLPSGATVTRGNNVDAYTDDNTPDGFSANDTRATTTSSGTFDYFYDFAQGPVANDTQRQASIVSLFYVNNWLHNYWYDSGFNEEAGNAQANNFGRGGLQGDRLRAEAQDSHDRGQRNNANMSTPSDGISPRMQMYSWTGTQDQLVRVVNGAIFSANDASFGPSNFDVTANLVLADDGDGTTTDGCQALLNTDAAGAIVLIDRGNCTFVQKVLNAQALGAAGVLIANNVASGLPPMGGSSTAVNIGSFGISQADGNTLKTDLQSGPVRMTIRRVNLERDGSFDYMVIAHEWGHYMHNRLADCGSNMCRGTGEGWADFMSLHTVVREGDDLNGTYGVGLWAVRGRSEAGYYGIRRAPYSTDPGRNALRFRHIADGEPLPTSHPMRRTGPNSQVHRTGEVWSSMLFDAYVSLLRPTLTSTSMTFADGQRRFADIIVAGLMMVPRDATFTEQRDSLLAAAAVQSTTDMVAIANAFAARGAGTCAESPPRYAGNNSPVVEGYGVQPILTLGDATLDDSLWSCDSDGTLDSEEEGIMRVLVSNSGPFAAEQTVVALASSTPGIVLPQASTTVDIAPYSSQLVELPVHADPGIVGTATLTVVISAVNGNACEPTVTSTVVQRFNVDEVAASFDNVEASSTQWTLQGTGAGDIWSRQTVDVLQRAWRGIDFSRPSDTALLSPTLEVGTGTLTIAFDHRYRFEAQEEDGSGTNWDGAVIEISGDNGQTWEDVSVYTTPGYGGTLSTQASNPLGGRQGLVGTSPAWPARERLTLSFGTAFSQQQVRLRLRIGTDQSVGEFGWEIDNITVTGIDNLPFFTIAPDSTICPARLIADAGPSQTVDTDDNVLLDGRGSVSAQNLPLTFSWAQTFGPPVELVDGNTAQPSWVAPPLTTTASVGFTLVVGDGVRLATDDVVVTINAAPAPIANAGEDQDVVATASVALDGSSSTYDPRLPIAFTWTQVDGPAVALATSTGTVTTFIAPIEEEAVALAFELSITDGVRTSTDGVVVRVAARPLDDLVVEAGEDQAVEGGDVVTLTGSATGDRRLPITLSWAQTEGPAVTFTENMDGRAVFTASAAVDARALTFTLTGDDGQRMASDDVSVTVAAAPPPPPPPPPVDAPNPSAGALAEDDGGCGCSTHGTNRPGVAAAWGLLLVAWLFGRRRLRRR